ncbi:MAG: Uncharacterised protein [Opitutia bacterium UBA7350]|nr:MAG: Uncharacterised protein [Opitutae bacterium UBA7350]
MNKLLYPFIVLNLSIIFFLTGCLCSMENANKKEDGWIKMTPVDDSADDLK